MWEGCPYPVRARRCSEVGNVVEEGYRAGFTIGVEERRGWGVCAEKFDVAAFCGSGNAFCAIYSYGAIGNC